MTRVIAFDVNETLLDLRALDDPLARIFGDPALRPQWFALMLQVGFVGGLTGAYIDFTMAQRAALGMLAEREQVELSPGDADAVIAAMRILPAHPEVPAAVRRLRRSPLRLVALTNSVTAVAEAQLTNAGLREEFDDVVSADSVARLKPAPDPYLAVARLTAVDPGEVRLVAAHHWDITGALCAGLSAAFVARPGAMLNPVGPQPDIVGSDLDDVVSQILRKDT